MAQPLRDYECIQHCDATKLLKKLADDSVGLMFMHPPPDAGVGSSDKQTTHDERYQALAPIAVAALRVLKPGAQVVVAGEVEILLAWHRAAIDAGFSFMGDIGVAWNPPGKRLRLVGGQQPSSWLLNMYRYVKPGYSRRQVLELRYANVLVAMPVPKQHREHASTCQLPLELMNFVVTAFSREGDLVVDPMCGSGSTLVAAELNEREWLGGDKDEKWVLVARARVANAEVEEHGQLMEWPPNEDGTLKPIGGQ